MLYAADTTIAQTPSLQALPDDKARQQALDDAGRLYTYLKRNPWASQDELATYGERNQFPPDRLNVARDVLLDLGRIVGLNDAGVAA